jgi:hypothetical protein
VSPVRYDPRFYVPEDAILHSEHHEDGKSYTNAHYFIVLPTLIVTVIVLQRTRVVSYC